MEWNGSVVSWVKLYLWFCFEKRCVLVERILVKMVKNWSFLVCSTPLRLGVGVFLHFFCPLLHFSGPPRRSEAPPRRTYWFCFCSSLLTSLTIVHWINENFNK